MRRLGYRAGRAGSHLCSAPADTADETGARDLALQTGSRTWILPKRLLRYRLCCFWHMSGFNLEARPGCSLLDAVSWLTNSVLCVALWSKHKILNPFLPLPVQEAAGGNMILWWEASISFLGWSFYHHMALVGAVTTHAVEGLVIQSTASAESNFLITQLCLQCGFL